MITIAQRRWHRAVIPRATDGQGRFITGDQLLRIGYFKFSRTAWSITGGFRNSVVSFE